MTTARNYLAVNIVASCFLARVPARVTGWTIPVALSWLDRQFEIIKSESPVKPAHQLSRREFVRVTSTAAAAIAAGDAVSAPSATPSPLPPTAIFSKIFQELSLSCEDSAEATAEAGFDGIDCPARPGGQVLPERAAEDLPRYAETLSKHGRRILLLTTAITGLNSPHAETLLRSGAKLGVKHYRLGYWKYSRDHPPEETLREIKAQLKDLAALNHELGLCALLQNHAGRDYVGAKVRDLWQIAREFDPSEVGIAFDLGHALNELGEDWRATFEQLSPRLAVAYVKDWTPAQGFVPFGEGMFAKTDFFQRLKRMHYSAPLSVHNEYDWAGGRKEHTRARLTAALKSDLTVLKRWWTGA